MIYLIGISGVGKTTIGKLLAARIGYDFIDLDARIEALYKCTVGELFERGEAHFRDCERTALLTLPTRQKLIVATGGGVVLRRDNIRHMCQTGIVICLHRSLKSILQSIDSKSRPLLKGKPIKLYKLYRQRRRAYLRAADCRVIARRPQRAVNKIARSL
ncbi:MAG: shikimate kinase [Clostridiales bacterium]|nr:MAG: shikimate kinase [Clostridiales bacterium]